VHVQLTLSAEVSRGCYVELAAAWRAKRMGRRATVKLTALKPRLATIPGRLQMAATLSTQRLRGQGSSGETGCAGCG
jgi:hypothetical protein